jgi:pyrroloquinoline quinone biosynthesis protein B
LFYCPDIDRWEAWEQDIRAVVDAHNVALLDATFFSGAELPGRDMSKIPHPLVTDTVARMRVTTA